MPRHFQVHTLLDSSELAELEEFAREPGRTVDSCYDWMAARGYTISRSAVGTWKREFSSTDRFRASNETARALMDAAKKGGAVAVSDAAMLQLSQMIFEQLLSIQDGGEIATKEIWAMSMAMKNLVTGQRHLETLKGEVADALVEAQKSASAGGSASDVVAKVRDILGIREAA